MCSLFEVTISEKPEAASRCSLSRRLPVTTSTKQTHRRETSPVSLSLQDVFPKIQHERTSQRPQCHHEVLWVGAGWT